MALTLTQQIVALALCPFLFNACGYEISPEFWGHITDPPVAASNPRSKTPRI